MFRPRVPHVEQAAGCGKYRRNGGPCRHFPGKLGKSLDSSNTSGMVLNLQRLGHQVEAWVHKLAKSDIFEWHRDIWIYFIQLSRACYFCQVLLYVASIITSISRIDPSLRWLLVQKFWVRWVLEAAVESTWLACPLGLPTTSSTLTVLFLLSWHGVWGSAGMFSNMEPGQCCNSFGVILKWRKVCTAEIVTFLEVMVLRSPWLQEEKFSFVSWHAEVLSIS